MTLIDLSTTGPHKLILCCPLCPGDVLTMTAAVESLHLAYPGKFLTDVRTSTPEIWDCNPWITQIDDEDPDAVLIDMSYSRYIVTANRIPHNFLGCYGEWLGSVLGIPVKLLVNRPQLYLVDVEREWSMVDRFFNGKPTLPIWLVCAGSKSDYPAKQWPVEYFQEVIDRTRPWITWVQIGANERGEYPHAHPKLERCIDLVGKTGHRDLHRIMFHACGGLGGVTYLMHVAAALNKSYVCLAGGREPATWINYPKQHHLHTIGQLPCCETWSCWKSRLVPIGDGHDMPEKLCERPVLDMAMPVAKCMELIRPSEVIQIIERHLEGMASQTEGERILSEIWRDLKPGIDMLSGVGQP